MTPTEPANQSTDQVADSTAVIDLDALERTLLLLRTQYKLASPFPHIGLDGFLLPDVARRAEAEFPPVDHDHWINYFHANERKFSNTDPTSWGPTLQSVWRELTSLRFIAFLSALTGIDNLVSDDSLKAPDCTRRRQGVTSTSTPTSPCIPISDAGGDAPISLST